ncbi:putative oxidoreductase [Medicago truncatula]|uniref:Putative oxidoreductase n=1 Tax=Medicago truncatula TaxID=3880 RepID=A0A396HM45_MEDTR|nr:putative oxidoreductase [Medicago truncatula]
MSLCLCFNLDHLVPIHLNLWMYRRSTPITKEHIEINLGGLALEEDQHECNGLCDKADLVLETSIIELSIPHSTHKPSCMQIKVLKLESTIWLLAKARVIVNDSCYHASTHKPLIRRVILCENLTLYHHSSMSEEERELKRKWSLRRFLRYAESTYCIR